MKTIHNSWRELGADVSIIILAFATFFIALKYYSFVDNWVWLPWFPNIVDTVMVFLASVTLLYLGLTRRRRRKKN